MNLINSTQVYDRIESYRKEAYLRELSPSFRQHAAKIIRQIAQHLDENSATKAQGGSYVHT